eukprot:766710-Hanusia_phi.AAC.1
MITEWIQSIYSDLESCVPIRHEPKDCGVGINFTYDANGGLVVHSLVQHSPAALAGVHPGDVLYEIDGKPCFAAPLERVTAMLTGPENSYVRMTFRRKEQFLKLDIRRVFRLHSSLPECREDEESKAASKPKPKLFEYSATASKCDLEESTKLVSNENGNKRKSDEFHVLPDSYSDVDNYSQSSFSKENSGNKFIDVRPTSNYPARKSPRVAIVCILTGSYLNQTKNTLVSDYRQMTNSLVKNRPETPSGFTPREVNILDVK